MNMNNIKNGVFVTMYFLTIIVVLIAVFLANTNSDYVFYFTVVNLLCVILLFLINLKSFNKKDYMYYPLIALLLFDIFLIIKNDAVNEKLIVVNIVFALFGFYRYYYKGIYRK